MKSQIIPKLILILVGILIAASTATAQYEAEKLFAFLQDTYNRHDKNLYDFLIRELDQYAQIFPDEKNAAEAHYLCASIYEAKGEKHEALASFLKAMFRYPNSTRHEACANAARKIISSDKAYAPKKEALLARIDAEFGGATAADRYYDYLRFLVEMDVSNLYAWLLEEANKFISQFPSDTRMDMILRWSAEVLAKKGDHRQAAASYLKLDYAYPESPLLPNARYNRAVILYKELGENERAVEVFTQVVTAYPDSDCAGSSLFMLGEVKQKKLKDFKGAIADYRKLVDTYPKNTKVVDALFAIAEINTDKLAAPSDAIAVYDEIVAKHASDERGIKALEKAGDLYRNKMADFGKAAEYYAKVAELYPTYEKAPDMLLKAGALCEDKLKDYKKAAFYYEIIVDKFPEHRMTAEAKSRLARAQERLDR